MGEGEPVLICLESFNGTNWVALESPYLDDSILLTPQRARALAELLVAHADAIDPPTP